jgi:hypothetical protein
MAYEQKDNTATAFKNKRKESDKHADFTGSGMFMGVEMWVNVWVNKDKNNETYFKFQARPKEQPQDRPNTPKETSFEGQRPTTSQRAMAQSRALDDDVPFAPEFR